MQSNRPERGQHVERSFHVKRADQTVNEDARTVDLAFSSETPVERWYGTEILSHDSRSVRMDRLNDGAAVLVNHDSDQQVGVIESAQIDGDRKGRASIRFGSGVYADEIFRDVRDGIRQLVSVGYIIHDLEETQSKSGPSEVRITDWEPLEVSIVSVPADASVGVGRNISAGNTNEDPVMDNQTDARDVRDNTESLPAGDGEDIIVTTVTDGYERDFEREGIDAEIKRLGERFGCESIASDLIELDGSVEDMRDAAKEFVKARKPQSLSTQRGLQVAGESFQPAPYRGKLRGFRSERDAYASGMWLRGQFFGDRQAARWCQENISQVRALSEGIASAGGFLVPDEMSSAIIDLREERGIARQLANVETMTSDTLSVPRVSSGVTAYWTGENAALTESDMAFDNVELVARKLTALTKVSSEVLEDAAIDLANKVAERQAYAFADKEDEAFINGDGTSTYGGIYGLMPKIINGSHTAGAVDATTGTNTFAEIDADDINSLMAVLPVYASRGAQWLISQPGKALVFDALAQAAGGNTMTMLGDRPRPAYLGYPIAVSQVAPTSTGDLENLGMFAFGDFNQACMMGSRREIRMQLLMELYAANDQVGFKGTERVDIVWHELGDTSTAGSVVVMVGA